jgi:hypothetical protein
VRRASRSVAWLPTRRCDQPAKAAPVDRTRRARGSREGDRAPGARLAGPGPAAAGPP